MLLCDSVQAQAGKLFILGGGWSITGPGPAPMGLAIKFEVPWDQANHKFHFEIELLDADGQPARVQTPMGEQGLKVEGDLEAGRPSGLKPGTPLDVPLALNIPPIQLPADSRFSWKLTVDGQTQEDWQVGFTTRANPQT